jgi:hypothetical protein
MSTTTFQAIGASMIWGAADGAFMRTARALGAGGSNDLDEL